MKNFKRVIFGDLQIVTDGRLVYVMIGNDIGKNFQKRVYDYDTFMKNIFNPLLGFKDGFNKIES